MHSSGYKEWLEGALREVDLKEFGSQIGCVLDHARVGIPLDVAELAKHQPGCVKRR
jgi:hypothetical protein